MTEAPILSYTEVTHTERFNVNPSDPMEHAEGWRFWPTAVALTFCIRTQMDLLKWNEPKVEITGRWIQRHDQPERPGTALLMAWDQSAFPDWLTELIEAHRPTWLPELPPAILPKPRPNRAT